MNIEYLACGNIMSDRIEDREGNLSEWNMGGPAFYALSGMRIWTKDCKLVCKTGADYADTYGKWMDANGVTRESVREELEHVRNYLVIQKMRFRDRFVYTIHAQEECLAERTVKLIVQPLAENCISHAIDEARDGELHIAIRAWVTEKDLWFSVTDDGLGISPERLPQLLCHSGSTGFGLKNVHERIQLTYGPEYGLQYRSTPGQGTEVQVRIPFRPQSD